jgi:tetratricopeptide (TPR) repeat protein
MSNLAIQLMSRRNVAAAESLLQERLKSNSGVIVRDNLVHALTALGQFPRADSLIRVIRRENPANLAELWTEAGLRMAQGDFGAVERLVDSTHANPDSATRDWSAQWRAMLLLLHGQPSAAGALFAATHDTLSNAAIAIRAMIGAWPVNQPVDAITRLDADLAHRPLRAQAQDDRDDLDVAVVYAVNGRPDKARTILAAFRSEITDTSLRRVLAPDLHTALGEIALAEHRPQDAIREFRAGDMAPDGPVNECSTCLPLELGRAFDAAGMTDSAIAMFNRYLNTPEPISAVPFSASPELMFPYVHLRLGHLYDAVNDRTAAAAHYRAFLDLYRHPEPAVQPLVTEARQRLARLGDAPITTSLPTKH